MTSTSSSRPVPRPLQLPSASSSPRSSPVMAKSPLASARYYNNSSAWSEGKDSPVGSPRIASRRQSSLSYNTTSPASTLQSESQHHMRRNTDGGGSSGAGNDGAFSKSPITTQSKDGSSRSRSLLPPVKETEPATLAEKHADLLRFIAQKESKCLELRTQLTQHEAELLLLKQKWERIVSKGSPALPGVTPESSAPTTRNSSSDVLIGIRDGVQNGFEKVMAVLEPAIAGSSSSSSESSSASSSSGSPVSTTTSIPLPSRHRPSSSAIILKHNKNAESLSSTQGRSSVSSSVSSLFDETQSNGTRSLDSPVLDDGVYTAQKPKLLPLTNHSSLPSNVTPFIATKNRPSSLSSTFSQLSSSLSSSDGIGKHVATWVSPSLNKKWEELRTNETISKQSKRASLLFNDMLSVLSSSGSISTTSPGFSSPQAKHHAADCPSTPISPLVLDPVVGAFITPGTYSSLSSSSASLLEDSEDGPKNELGVVLQPDDRGLPVIQTSTRARPDNTNATTIKRKTPDANTTKVRDVGVSGPTVDDYNNSDDDDDDDDRDKWNW